MNTQCVYCGNSNPETKDHLPPKNLFPKPRPENLITVPCCEICRILTNTDDEYFRNMLTMNRNAERHPDVQKVLENVHRSFERPEHIKLVKHLIATMEQVNIPGSSKEHYSYTVDKARVDKVVGRIVRGIYAHENKNIYPLDGQIVVYCLDFLDHDKRPLLYKFNEMFLQTPTKIIGNNIFQYKMAKQSEEHLEMWWLCFYESIIFYAILMHQQ